MGPVPLAIAALCAATRLRPLILALGTRGDVAPCVALARELQARGHCPLVCAFDDLVPLVASEGVASWPAGVASVSQPAEWLACRTRADMLAHSAPEMRANWRTLGESYYRAAQAHEADVILATSMADVHGLDIAERLAVPCWAVRLAPDLDGEMPTAALPPAGYRDGGPVGNVAAHLVERARVIAAVARHGLIASVLDFRREVLGLPGLRLPGAGVEVPLYSPFRQRLGRRRPVLFAVSDHLCPRPSEYRHDDQPYTGFWLPDGAGRAPPATSAVHAVLRAPCTARPIAVILDKDVFE